MIKSFLLWCREHPEFTILFIVPLATAPINWLFKPRTPEEFAELPPRLAGFLRVLAGAGFDPSKVSQGLQMILTGRVRSVAEMKGSNDEKNAD